MKVAIIGAGLSGLSCAHELKKHEVAPTIFEKKSFTGEVLDHQTIIQNIFDPLFYGDVIKFLKKNYSIDIKPQFVLKELIVTAPNGKVYTARGNLGYILKRGPAQDGIVNQIAQAVNLPIQFNTFVDIKDIINDYDHIVVATASDIIPKQFDIYSTTFVAHVRIATVLGDIKTETIKIWINTEFSKNTITYLVPYSPKCARLILIVNGISHEELDYYWDKFLETVKIPYTITEIRDVEHITGFVDPVQVGRVYFTGVAAGLMDNVFGFAATRAIISGVTAAQAIVNNQNYDKMLQPLKDIVKQLHEFRTVLNTLDNKAYNTVLAAIDLPIIKQFIYNNPLSKVTQATFLAKAYNYVWRKTKEPK